MFDGQGTQTKILDFDVASASIKGSRDYQEDSMLVNFPMGQGSGFAIIADGIGGHVAGHLASAIVTTEVFTHMKMQEGHLASGALNVPFALRQAATEANNKVAEHVRRNDETKGMGSTLLAPVIRGDRLSWLSIGDSPLYLLRDGALRQLNKDHSMAPQIDMMVKTGSMKAEVGKDHPDRNTLTSVVNGEEIAEIDCPKTPIQIKEGDILIASTDGLQTLSNSTLAKTIMKGTQQSAVELVKSLLAELSKLDAPDQDNTTFAVMKAMAPPKVEEVMDLDAMPVLALADDDEAVAAPVAAAAPEAVEPAKPVKDEKKAYWYRGQKYYRD
ncbi:MAG: PP2C family serine/threonine-protein phosphatase [Pseudomonadota bacterium]